MIPKFTPGPWKYYDEGTIGQNDIVSGEAPKDGGDIICSAPLEWESSMKRWNANAKLIAAAPEMYETLSRIGTEISKVKLFISTEEIRNWLIDVQIEIFRVLDKANGINLT